MKLTPLHLATMRHEEAVPYLIAAGANIYFLSKSGQCVLYHNSEVIRRNSHMASSYWIRARILLALKRRRRETPHRIHSIFLYEWRLQSLHLTVQRQYG
jgi:hypothetical protein